MKKVFSLVAVALLTVSVLFTACRDNASTTTEGQETPATEAPVQEAAPAQEAGNAAPGALTTPLDTTAAQQAQ